jgi:hypothetical protein
MEEKVQEEEEEIMIYITKGLEKVAVETVEDVKALQSALTDYNNRESVTRQDIIGKETKASFRVCFDTYEIKAIGQNDAVSIEEWLLALGADNILIQRVKE